MSESHDDGTAAGTAMLEALGISLNTEDSLPEEFAPIEVVQPAVVVASPPEFAVPRQILTGMIDRVMEVLPTKSDFLPALKSVVLSVSETQLSMTASDSTRTVITHTSAVRVTRPGRVLIAGAKFADVVRRANGPEVSLRVDDQMLYITSGVSSWSLRISSVQDYVPLPDLGDLTWCQVDRTSFVRAIAACRFAASSDDNDPARQQLYFSHGSVTAADRGCFAQVSGMLPEALSCEMSVTAADLFVKMLEYNDAKDFRLADSAFHTVAEIGPPESADRVFVAHIAEPFPAESALSMLQTPLAENRDELVVSGSALVEALRRAVPTADEQTEAIALSPEASRVTVATRNRYHEVSTEPVEATFRRSGSETVPAARTVLLSHSRLVKAVRAVNALGAGGSDEDTSGSVLLRLGVDRSVARRAFVLVESFAREDGGLARVVLSQVRSDFWQ